MHWYPRSHSFTTIWSGVLGMLFLSMTVVPFLPCFTKLTRFATRKSLHFTFIGFLMCMWIHKVSRRSDRLDDSWTHTLLTVLSYYPRTEQDWLHGRGAARRVPGGPVVHAGVQDRADRRA
jgi:hypothetical protein